MRTRRLWPAIFRISETNPASQPMEVPAQDDGARKHDAARVPVANGNALRRVVAACYVCARLRMDSLTHGLLGAATTLLPLPRRFADDPTDASATRASILVGVLAAELPDLDYLLPAGDEVLHALRAHRGLSHALIAVPLVALVAALSTKLVFRRARFAALYARALIAVPFAHLLPDLWTGWGTRLLLPFSERRFALDWSMVVDPFFTLPLLAAALGVLFRRVDFRRAFRAGLLVSTLYLAARVLLSQHLTAEVRRAYPDAEAVSVFPALLSVSTFRYVATVGGEYRAGTVSPGAPPREQAREHRISVEARKAPPDDPTVTVDQGSDAPVADDAVFET